MWTLFVQARLLKDLFVFKNVNTVFREGYKNAKKEHVALLNSKKKQYYQNRIINSDNTVRASWNVVSELVNNNDDNNKKTYSNIHINKNGILVKDPYEIAADFNQFFVETPVRLVSQTHPKNIGRRVESNIFNQHSLYLKPFTEKELLTLLNGKLKNKKSSGSDDIPSFILKQVLDVIIAPLAYLINRSFESGMFPQNMKTGKVTPLYKKKRIHYI